MKRLIFYIVAAALVFSAIFAVWLKTPEYFLNSVTEDKILYIDIFDGNSGENYKIIDETDISYIINNIKKTPLKKSGLSAGRKGYAYRLTFFDKNGEIVEKFIINSADTLRKDPFFYHDKSGKLPFEHLKAVLAETKTQ